MFVVPYRNPINTTSAYALLLLFTPLYFFKSLNIYLQICGKCFVLFVPVIYRIY